MKKSLFLLILSLLIIGTTAAYAEMDISLEKVITEITPIFMEGHQGEMEWFEGYNFSGNIIFENNKIGEFSAKLTLLNPPMIISERYEEGFVIFEHVIKGLGRFESYAQATAFGAMGAADTGQIMFGYHGSIANGSDSLSGIAGLTSGCGTFNIFTLKGSSKEMLSYTFESVE